MTTKKFFHAWGRMEPKILKLQEEDQEQGSSKVMLEYSRKVREQEDRTTMIRFNS